MPHKSCPKFCIPFENVTALAKSILEKTANFRRSKINHSVCRKRVLMCYKNQNIALKINDLRDNVLV